MILPNFLIIGAAKAATTSLYHYLDAHPEVFMSLVKEVNFFAYSPKGLGFPPDWEKEKHHEIPAKTLEQYAALFQSAGSFKAVGEASPLYLDSPYAPDRIRRTLPEVRLIVSLRNPVDRLISDFKMRIRCGFASESLGEALRPGMQLYELGFVSPRLARYYELFRREQIKVLLFDEIVADPAAVMRDTYGFLEVSDAFTPDLEKRYNTASGRRGSGRAPGIRGLLGSWKHSLIGGFRKAGIEPDGAASDSSEESLSEFRDLIRKTYRDDVLRLEEMTGRDLSGWIGD